MMMMERRMRSACYRSGPPATIRYRGAPASYRLLPLQWDECPIKAPGPSPSFSHFIHSSHISLLTFERPDRRMNYNSSILLAAAAHAEYGSLSIFADPNFQVEDFVKDDGCPPFVWPTCAQVEADPNDTVDYVFLETEESRRDWDAWVGFLNPPIVECESIPILSTSGVVLICLVRCSHQEDVVDLYGPLRAVAGEYG